MTEESAGPLREMPLAAEHRALGARMVPFAGWNMPVQYAEGILAEHHHTRTHVSLFDICHMGEFRVTGGNAAECLDCALARSVADQPEGVCRYNFLLNDAGGVMDDLIVYRLSAREFYIVVNAGTRPRDAALFRERLAGSGCAFTDESDATAKLDLQGPESVDVLRRFGFAPENLPGYYKFIETEFNGKPCLLSRTGYTGELGFELYFAAEHAVANWRALLAVNGVKPAGLGARDTLRLEMGYSLYGHELNESTTPVEAGAAGLLKRDGSARNFPGAAALRTVPPKKHLIALALEGRRTARSGDAVLSSGGEEVGAVTSGAFGPSVGTAIALAYVCAEAADRGLTEYRIRGQRGDLAARVTDIPFYRNGTARRKFQ